MAEIALEAVTIRTPCSPSNKSLTHDLQKFTFVTNYTFRWKRRLPSSWSYAHAHEIKLRLCTCQVSRAFFAFKLICYGKEGSERIESWHLAGSNLFLSFWETFFLFTYSKYDRPLNESTTCRGNVWKRPKNNSQICNFQLKKKKKTPTKWLSFLAKSAYSQPTDCRALDDKTLMLVSHDIDG